MMSALEECRKELLMKAEVAEGEPVNEEVYQPLKMEEKEEESLESNRDRVKEAAIAMEQEVRKEEEEEEKAALVEEEKVIQKEEELITDMKDETAMEVSMVEQGEQEVLPMVRHLVEEDSNGNIATTLVPQQQNMEEEEGCGQVLQQCDEHDDAMCGQEMQDDDAVDRGTCSEVGGDTSDNKLNTTYTIESPEHLVDDPNDALSSSLLCHDSSKSPCECLSFFLLHIVSVCLSVTCIYLFSHTLARLMGTDFHRSWSLSERFTSSSQPAGSAILCHFYSGRKGEQISPR